MTENELQEKKRAVQQALSVLSRAGIEHAQILTTWDMDGVTHSWTDGFGNFYARKQLADDWVNMSNQPTLSVVVEGDEDQD